MRLYGVWAVCVYGVCAVWMYAIQPPYTGDGTRRVGCMAVFGLYGTVCVYGLLYGTGAQGVGVDSPSSIESTPSPGGRAA